MRRTEIEARQKIAPGIIALWAEQQSEAGLHASPVPLSKAGYYWYDYRV